MGDVGTIKPLEKYESVDEEKKKELLNEAALSQQFLITEETIEHGTIPITQEVFTSAKNAIDARIKSTKDYTSERLSRMKKSSDLYEQKIKTDTASNKLVYPGIFNSVEDWMDDLYLTFNDLIGSLELSAEGHKLNDFLPQKLSVGYEDEATKPLAFIDSMARMLPGLKDKIAPKTDMYYFRRKDSIQAALKYALKLSGYEKKLEDYLYTGCINGEFCFKEGWGPIDKYKIEVCESNEGSPKGKEYLSLGKYKHTVANESAFKFQPVNPEFLIFPKTNRKWIMEKIPHGIFFQQLLSDTLDENGKPKENALYDLGMIMMIKDYLKKNDTGGKQNTDDEKKFNYQTRFPISEVDTDAFNVDKEIELLESHHIPLTISYTPKEAEDGKKKKKGKKQSTKKKTILCLVVSAVIDNEVIPIRVQASPFVRGIPYKMSQFFYKSGDESGRSLAEVLEKINSILTGMQAHTVDAANMGIWGVTVANTKKIENPEALGNITPRQMIKAKIDDGGTVNDVFSWLHPPAETISAANVTFDRLELLSKTTSRKGPSGEKISPNPSATEYASMMSELSKSVNRTSLRINNDLKEMIEDMYVYTILNRQSHMKLKMFGYNVKNPKDLKDPAALERNNIQQVEKDVELSVDEILIEGLGFDLKAVENNPNQQAVQKQQFMQSIEVLYNTLGVTEQKTTIDPGTGQPIPSTELKVYLDETGQPMVVDEYRIANDLFKNNSADGIFKKYEPEAPPQAPQGAGGGTSVPGVPGVGVPAPNPNADAGDILGQVAKV